MQDIRLVITSGGVDYEADLTNGFDLNLNYTFDNLTNPTELKNTYSKTIKLEGTAKNDMIFERYMDPHHRIVNITGHLRIPFKLFYGSTLYEKGYLKLNKINWNNVEHSYEINLFGELGKLIYELDEKTLASLQMPYNNLTHILNRDFIKKNWSNESERYHFSTESLDDILSYIPMNNGLYDDFNSNKVQTDKNRDGVELDGDYSEWEMAEFRSYKQRAAVKLSEIIKQMLSEATQSTDGNELGPYVPTGGYNIMVYEIKDGVKTELRNKVVPWDCKEVLIELEDDEEMAYISDSMFQYDMFDTYVSAGYPRYRIVFNENNTDQRREGLVTVVVEGRSSATYTPYQIRFVQLGKNEVVDDKYTIDDKFANEENPYWSRLYLTMPKFDEGDLGGDNKATKFVMRNSDSNALLSGEYTATLQTAFEDTEYRYDPQVALLTVQGTDAQRRYTTVSTEGGQMGNTILNADNTFNFTKLEDGASLTFKATDATFPGYCSYRQDIYAVRFNGKIVYDVRLRDLSTNKFLKIGQFEVGNTTGPDSFWNSSVAQSGWNESTGEFIMPVVQYGVEYKVTKSELMSIGGGKVVMEIVPQDGAVMRVVPLERDGMNPEFYCSYYFKQPQISWKIYDTTSSETGYKMSWMNLIDKESTCSQLLLSYIKMFGLLLEVDKYDGTINIWTREGYFKDHKILDWSDKLDRSREATLNPITFKHKYTLFDYADTKNGYLDTYKDKYGINYGCKKRDTSYEFNNSTEELIKNMFFQNSITVTNSINAIFVDDKVSKGRTKVTLPCSFEWSNNEMEAVDSQYQLFFKGITAKGNSFRITDDTNSMKEKSEIMWNATSENNLSGSDYPLFSDYFMESWGNEMESEIKTFSTHFAKPRKSWNDEIDDTVPESAFIFDKFHKNYFEDLYDKDTKVLTAYFYLTPADMLSFSFRDFVMVDGVLYHPNKIMDYNILSHNVTKVELVQVQDIYNYISNGGGFADNYYLKSEFTGYSMGTAGGTFDPVITTNGTVQMVNPVDWITLNSDLTFTLAPFDGTQRTHTLVLTLLEDPKKTLTIYFAQTSERDHTFRVVPNDVNVNMEAGSFGINYIIDGTQYTTLPLEYTVTAESDSAWLFMGHIATGQVAYQENTSGYQRSGEMTLCCKFPDNEIVCAPLKVTQGLENYYLRISPDSITADSKGGIYYFNVETNSASPIIFKGIDEGGPVVDVKVLVDGRVMVVVAENTGNDDLSSVLHFGIKENDFTKADIPITQKGAGSYYLTVLQTKAGEFIYNADMKPYGNKTEKIFDSNGTMYQVSSTENWIRYDANGRLWIDDNLTTEERRTIIKVGVKEDASLVKEAEIIQRPAGVNYYLNVTPNVVSDFPAAGGTITFAYDTNSVDGVHISVSSGEMMSIVDNHNGTATLTVKPNGSENGRTGSVKFWIDELSDEITVYVGQAAKGSQSISVIPTSKEASPESGCYDFDVLATRDWVIDMRTIPSWMTITKDDDKVTICCTENDGETRVVNVRLYLGDRVNPSARNATIKFTQRSGYYLSDNQYEYTHNQDEGFVQTEIRTNGTPVVETIEYLDS